VGLVIDLTAATKRRKVRAASATWAREDMKPDQESLAAHASARQPAAVMVQREQQTDGPVESSQVPGGGSVVVLQRKGWATWRCIIQFGDGAKCQAGLISPTEPSAEMVIAVYRGRPEVWRFLPT
jgi:hypothetical protein